MTPSGPSVRSSSNLLTPSGCSMTSLYSSSLTLPEVSSKFPTAGGADAGCGTTKISPVPSASPLLYITMRMLVLLALCMTRCGGLKLVSSPQTWITSFGTLADNEWWKKARSKEYRKKHLGFRTGSTKVNRCGDDHTVYQVWAAEYVSHCCPLWLLLDSPVCFYFQALFPNAPTANLATQLLKGPSFPSSYG